MMRLSLISLFLTSVLFVPVHMSAKEPAYGPVLIDPEHNNEVGHYFIVYSDGRILDKNGFSRHARIEQTAPPQGPIAVSVGQNSTTNNSLSPVLNAFQSQAATVWSETGELYSQGLKKAQSLLSHISDVYKSYKYRTWFGLSLGVYAAIAIRMYTLSRSLKSGKGWSTWRRELSLEQLFLLDEQKLVADLLKSISLKSTQETLDKDALAPLFVFFNEVESEMKKLRAYHWWATTAERLYCARLFSIDTTLRDNCKERIDRLAYLKSRIAGAITEQKLTAMVAPAA